MARKRMNRGLVALSTSAIAAVYMAGYLRTSSADAAIGSGAAAEPVAAAVATVAPPSPTATPLPVITPTSAPATRRAPATPAPAAPTVGPSSTAMTAPAAPTLPSPTAGPATAAQYTDGTYTGTGSSRRGDVWVSVEVISGRIANVTITRSTLQYPLRDIVGLPAEVVERQSAQVDIVSRATYSSQAFRTAVSQALGKAAA